ncbi:MAG: dsRBD fold-containing protein [Acidimicrobiia bacterium]
MEAHVGDRVVVDAHKVGEGERRGEVLEVLHGAGGDRYRVRWDQGGHETLLAPGSDVRIEGRGGDLARTSMRIDVTITEDQQHAEAVARLRVRDRDFAAWGRARRNPEDPNVPIIGEELAVARALSDLSHQLVGAAADTLESKLGHSVSLHV